MSQPITAEQLRETMIETLVSMEFHLRRLGLDDAAARQRAANKYPQSRTALRSALQGAMHECQRHATLAAHGARAACVGEAARLLHAAASVFEEDFTIRVIAQDYAEQALTKMKTAHELFVVVVGLSSPLAPEAP